MTTVLHDKAIARMKSIIGDVTRFGLDPSTERIIPPKTSMLIKFVPNLGGLEYVAMDKERRVQVEHVEGDLFEMVYYYRFMDQWITNKILQRVRSDLVTRAIEHLMTDPDGAWRA